MDVDDAILRAIINGHHRFGEIFTKSNSMVKMTRATFDKHLKQLVADQYVRKQQESQNPEYSIDPARIRETETLSSLSWIDERIENNKQALNPTLQFFFSNDIESELEDIVRTHHSLIMYSLKTQNYLTIFMNSQTSTMERKAKLWIKKLDEMIAQCLKIMEKISPEIREDYERFMLLKLNYELEKTIPLEEDNFSGKALLEKYKKTIKRKRR